MKDFSCKPPVPPSCGEPCPPHYPPLCPPPKPVPPCPPQTVPSVVEGESYYQLLNDMNNRINTMCNVYNDVMNNSYQTLHELQRAAEENGAYYGPCEIWTEEGYYADQSAAYQITHKAVVDRRGEPIRMELALAYGNTTNSQVSQNLWDASKINYADKITPAQPIVAGRGWYGNAIWHGAPIQSASEPTLYTMGFTRSGVMRVYSNGVTVDQMLRDTIENAMGVPGVLIQNGQVTDPSFRANIPMADQQVSRVCIGQNLESREMIILTTGAENNVNKKGLTSEACAQILLQYGCDIAVELVEDASAEMMDKGSLMFTPKDNEVPDAYCFWFISRKRFYKTDYEREMAELMQNYGQAIWNTLLNKAEIEVTQANLQKEIAARIAADVAEQSARIAADEVLQNNINTETTERREADAALGQRIDTEISDREAADTALGARIDQEITDRETAVANEAAAREAADTVLQQNIDTEVSDRKAAISAEEAARQAADTTLQNNIDAETAARIKADSDLDAAIQLKLDQINTKLNGLESEIINLQTLTGLLQRQLAAALESITAIQTTITAIEEAVSNITKSIEDIRNGVTDLPYLPTEGGMLSGPVMSVISTDIGQPQSVFFTLLSTKNSAAMQLKPETDGIEIAVHNESAVPGTLEKYKLTLTGNGVQINGGDGGVTVGTAGTPNKIMNVSTPTEGSDAATKAYVDAAIPAGIQPASETTLGGIMVGDNLSITPEGKLSANAGGYTLPAATADTLGGVKVGANLTATADGILSAPAPGMTEAAADAKYLAQAGGTVTGALTANQGVTVPTGQGVKSGNAGMVITGADTKISGTTVSLSSGADNTIPVKLSNLALPSVATDAATKAYVDSAVAAGSQYELPTATAARLGGVKVGQNLTVTDDGTLNAVQGTYTLPAATTTTLGGVKVGNDLTVTADGTLSAVNQRYSLPQASASVLGGVKVGQNLSVSGDGTLNAEAGGLPTTNPNNAQTTVNWNMQALRLYNSTYGMLIESELGSNGPIINTNGKPIRFTNATTIQNVENPTNATDVANKAYVDSKTGLEQTDPYNTENSIKWESSGYLSIAGRALKLSIDAFYPTTTPTIFSSDLQSKNKPLKIVASYIELSSSASIAEGIAISGVKTPTVSNQAANKAYVDSKAASAASDAVASHTHTDITNRLTALESSSGGAITQGSTGSNHLNLAVMGNFVWFQTDYITPSRTSGFTITLSAPDLCEAFAKAGGSYGSDAYELMGHWTPSDTSGLKPGGICGVSIIPQNSTQVKVNVSVANPSMSTSEDVNVEVMFLATAF